MVITVNGMVAIIDVACNVAYFKDDKKAGC